MKRLMFIIPMLACCFALTCLSFTDVKDSYLVLQVDTTQKYEQYSYVNEKGETVVPYNRYLLCYTDTIRTIGFVLKPNVGCVAINNQGQELFNVYMADNGNDYPVDGLFRILDESGQKMGVANMEGKVVVNTLQIPSMPVLSGKRKYPQTVLEELKARTTVLPLNATQIATDIGNPKSANVVLLGALIKALDLTDIDWKSIISRTVKPKFVDINLKAFDAGMAAV